MKTTEQMVEVMQAFARGEKIESMENRTNHPYRECHAPVWDWLINDYRIAPKPKKQIKMLCWFDGDQMFWLAEGKDSKWPAIRVPEEDKIIFVEVEE